MVGRRSLNKLRPSCSCRKCRSTTFNACTVGATYLVSLCGVHLATLLWCRIKSGAFSRLRAYQWTQEYLFCSRGRRRGHRYYFQALSTKPSVLFSFCFEHPFICFKNIKIWNVLTVSTSRSFRSTEQKRRQKKSVIDFNSILSKPAEAKEQGLLLLGERAEIDL